MKLPIVRPYYPLLSDIENEFAACLYEGQVTNGRNVRAFESALARHLDVGVIAFCNGQTALMAMLLAAGVCADDEVILPSFTFCGTPHAVAALGAIPVFADINPDTLTLDPGDAAKKITKRTAAILGVDVYGMACEYEALSELGHLANVKVMFDSAPAFGSTIDGRPAHRMTHIFSFHATKPFSTMEGGALITQDSELLHNARQVRDFGQDDTVAAVDHSRACLRVGLNGKMTEIAAIVGLENLKQWPRRVVDRRLSATRLRRHLALVPGISVIAEPKGHAPIWTYMPVLANAPERRPAMLARLREAHIEARTYYPACHKIGVYNSELSLPVTEDIAARVIALPLYDVMTDEEMRAICGALE